MRITLLHVDGAGLHWALGGDADRPGARAGRGCAGRIRQNPAGTLEEARPASHGLGTTPHFRPVHKAVRALHSLPASAGVLDDGVLREYSDPEGWDLKRDGSLRSASRPYHGGLPRDARRTRASAQPDREVMS